MVKPPGSPADSNHRGTPSIPRSPNAHYGAISPIVREVSTRHDYRTTKLRVSDTRSYRTCGFCATDGTISPIQSYCCHSFYRSESFLQSGNCFLYFHVPYQTEVQQVSESGPSPTSALRRDRPDRSFQRDRYFSPVSGSSPIHGHSVVGTFPQCNRSSSSARLDPLAFPGPTGFAHHGRYFSCTGRSAC